jgi:hypothetical protein
MKTIVDSIISSQNEAEERISEMEDKIKVILQTITKGKKFISMITTYKNSGT